jgi:MFS family permease
MGETIDQLSASQGMHLCRLLEPEARPRAYKTIALASFVLLVGANIPTPLYQVYRQIFNFSEFTITVIFGVYSLAVIPALLVFGPLGDAICRRRALLIALSIETIGVVLLAAARSVLWLLAGRMVIGMAIGAAQGNTAAALVEMQPQRNRRQAGMVTMASAIGGAAVGPLLSGLAGQYLPQPLLLSYLLELALLGVSLVLVAAIPEADNSYTLSALKIHHPQVPANQKGAFASASIAGGLMFSIAGIFLALVPSYVSDLLHIQNLAAGGAVVAIMMGSSVIGQLAMKNLPALHLQLLGLGSSVFGLLATVMAWPFSSLTLMFTGAIICGAGTGVGTLGSISDLNDLAPAEERGGVTSLYFALVYLFFSVPSAALGFTAGYIGLYPAVKAFAAAIAFLSMATMVWMILRHRFSTMPG